MKEGGIAGLERRSTVDIVLKNGEAMEVRHELLKLRNVGRRSGRKIADGLRDVELGVPG
jgi:hypothetical protein